MHSSTIWKFAQRPNYTTNVDKQYPYSEVPYIGEYNLVKIPLSLNDLIPHVDYWGEGKVEAGNGSSGFTNCYNVNHEYKLVSSGPDTDRKIPNRVPVRSYTDCDTSAYIKDNSVLTVTVSGTYINRSCARDIARIVNNDLGKVVMFGLEPKSQEINILTQELQEKGLICCPDYELPTELQGVTMYKSHISFLNVATLTDDLLNNITQGNFDNAVHLSKGLNNESSAVIITDIVSKLIITSSQNLMSYGYKLCNTGAKDIVQNYFPPSFALIFNQDKVTIVNKRFNKALKLDMNANSNHDRPGWGDSGDKTSKRVSWRLLPVWNNNSVTFKLYNIDRDSYLKLDANVDHLGDRQAMGSLNSNEERHRYYLEPYVKDDVLVFFIINCHYNQGLKLGLGKDRLGDRGLWGHNGNLYTSDERFRWLISAW